MGAEDDLHTAPSAAVAAMQKKAAELKHEIQGLKAGLTGFKQSGLKLEIPLEAGGDASPHPAHHASTPANPRFKPVRSLVTANSPDAEPFTPLGRPVVRSRVMSALSQPRSAGRAHRSVSTAAPGVGGEEGHLSPRSSVTSRRSASPKRGDDTGRRSGSPLRLSLAAQEAHAALVAQTTVLESQLEAAQRRVEGLEEECTRRQESYLRREDALQAQIQQLQTELGVARGQRNSTQDARFGAATDTIQTLHSQVVTEIEALLAKQAVSIKHEEQTQSRRLKNKLSEVEAELLAERGANGTSAADWVAKTQSLRAELDAVQEIATKLDSMYKLSEEECRRLRAQFKCQEDDREYLVRQVVGLKKENKRLAVELAAMASDAAAAAQERDDALQALQQAGQGVPGASGQLTTAVLPVDKDVIQVKVQRYEDVIESLKKVCEAERKRTRQARAAHLAELSARTELQSVLRQCLEDVRQQTTQVRTGITSPPATTADDRQPELTRQLHSAPMPSNLSLRSARPASALPARGVDRPSSAINRNGNPWATRRPVSAVVRSSTSQHAQHGALSQDPHACPLHADQRASLVRELQRREELLLSLLNTFPTAAPTLPSDTARLDALSAARDARDATVVANGRVLAAMRAAGSSNGRQVPASVAAGATPGNETAKVAAGRPWVFNVDTMLSDFLSQP